MAGMRVAAAACAALASAAPAAGQGDCGDLGDCLRPLAERVAGVLGREARERGERLDVSFRPARTEPSGLAIYCRALSRGLLNALHEGVQEERDAGLDFDLLIPDFMRVEPPEVVTLWTPDRTGGGVEILDVEVTVVLADRGKRQLSGAVPVSALSRAERGCLFSFQPKVARIAAPEAGDLFSEPSFREDAFEAEYEKDDVLSMRGCATAAGSVWPVVAWRNPDTRERRNLFAPALAAECGPDVVTAGGGGVVEDPPPPDEFAVGEVFDDCGHCPEMVVVPAGSFTMGSPSSEAGRNSNEGRQREVTIGAKFAVGVYEVTFDEWDACVSGGGCGGHDPDDQGWGRGGRPVIDVSWDDAKAYASWLSRETGESYRLLSEAEWEYVARAGTGTARYWGASASGQCRYANGADLTAKRHESSWTVADCDDGHYRTAPVGSFEPNGFGLHDVLGNVWEWVEDCWHENYARAPRDGRAWLDSHGGDCSRRVLRGGSWNLRPKILRAAYRGRLVTGIRVSNIGFRLLRSVRTFTP